MLERLISELLHFKNINILVCSVFIKLILSTSLVDFIVSDVLLLKDWPNTWHFDLALLLHLCRSWGREALQDKYLVELIYICMDQWLILDIYT